MFGIAIVCSNHRLRRFFALLAPYDPSVAAISSPVFLPPFTRDLHGIFMCSARISSAATF